MILISFVKRVLRKRSKGAPGLQRLIVAIKILLGQNPSGRYTTVFPDDIFIISYPKSGNTWTRFLIGNLINKESQITFSNVVDIVPDIHVSEKLIGRALHPRILKCHDPYDPRYRQVIYIVRDPRDVVISYYHHQLKFGYIQKGYSLYKYVEDFLLGGLDDYGSWSEHVGSWLGARNHSSGFVIVRYEDLLASPKDELHKIANLLRLNVDENRFDEVIQRSSFENMRKLEMEKVGIPKEFKADMNNEARNEYFVRSGKIGGWKNELPEDLAKKIEHQWRDQMRLFGYTE